MQKTADAARLVLRIGAVEHRFRSPQELERWLAQRLEPSRSRQLEAARLPAGDRGAVLEGLRAQIEQLEGILDRYRDDAAAFLEALRRIHPRALTEDHGWRTILLQLLEVPSAQAAWTQVALASYRRYLIRRLALLERFAALRRGGRRPRWDEVSMDLRQQTDNQLERRRVERIGARLRDGFVRLPPAERVVLAVAPGDVVQLMLAHRDFDLLVRHEGVIEFLDVHRTELQVLYGERRILHPGTFVIGRGSAADVPINRAYADVSRRHLLLTSGPRGLLEFTDLSSQGTFVSSEWAARLRAPRRAARR